MLSVNVRLPHDIGPKPHGEIIIRHISEYPPDEQERMMSARDIKAETMRATAAENKRIRDDQLRRYKEGKRKNGNS